MSEHQLIAEAPEFQQFRNVTCSNPTLAPTVSASSEADAFPPRVDLFAAGAFVSAFDEPRCLLPAIIWGSKDSSDDLFTVRRLRLAEVRTVPSVDLDLFQLFAFGVHHYRLVQMGVLDEAITDDGADGYKDSANLGDGLDMSEFQVLQ